MSDPTDRAPELAATALPAHEYLRPAVARVIQGVLDEAGALQREVEHERQRLAAIGVLAHSRNEAQLAGMLPEYESDALAGVRALVREVADTERDRDWYANQCDALAGERVTLLNEREMRIAELAKLRARDQRIRELAARVGTDESLIPAIPNLLDAIEETP